MNTPRHAIRALWRSPGLTVAAVASLALGIGANTAIFSLVDQVLFRPLAVRAPDEVVWVTAAGPDAGRGPAPLSYPAWRELRESNQAFTAIEGRMLLNTNAGPAGETERVWVEAVSGGFFSTLGIGATAGRLIQPEDDREGDGERVVVLSHRYWRDRFGADPSVVGRDLTVGGRPFRIVGVTAEEFPGLDLLVNPHIRIPLHALPSLQRWTGFESRRARWVNAIARLRPGVGPEAAAASLQPLYRASLERDLAHPDFRDMARDAAQRRLAGSLRLFPARPAGLEDRPDARPLSILLSVTAGLVLLVACANIANLLLARGAARTKEVAVRMALGASRARLIRGMMAESLVLALVGGAAGLPVARAVIRFALGFAPPGMPPAVTESLDGRVLLFSALLCAAAAFAFGLAPALGATRGPAAPALQEQGAGAGPPARHWARKLLAGAQVAVTSALLAAAGLCAASLIHLAQRDLGFRASGLAIFSVSPARSGIERDRIPAVRDRLTERFASMPGVASVAYSRQQALSGEYQMVRVGDSVAYFDAVSPGYFATLGVPLLSGREFGPGDAGKGYRLAIVNEAFSRRFADAGVSRTVEIQVGAAPLRLEVVGMVKDSRYAWLRGEPDPQIYVPILQDPSPAGMAFQVRAAGPAEALFGPVRAAVREVDPALDVSDLRTMEAQVDLRTASDRLAAWFCGGFGLIASVLAVTGVYGVMAYIVAGRRREIGVRMALGADSGSIARMVLREAMTMAGAGAVAGLPLSLAAGRALRSMLFEVEAQSLALPLVSALVLLAAAAAAALIPAVRASRVEPVRAITAR